LIYIQEQTAEIMKILITGAGLIGTHTAQAALTAGHSVVLLDHAPNDAYIQHICGNPPELKILADDLLNWSSLLALGDLKADILVHTAGVIGDQVNANPHRSIEVNVMGTVNMLELCHQLGIPRFVHLSSFGVYDRDQIHTETIDETAPLGRNRLYGACKVSIEQLVTALSLHYQIQTTILRPAAVFGHGHFVGGSGVGIAMADLMAQILTSDQLTLRRQDFPDNEYIYSKDVAMAVLKACESEGHELQIFNVGTGFVTPIEELAKVIQTAFPNNNIQISGAAKDQKKTPLNLDRATHTLGFKPTFSMAEALLDYAVVKLG
jgi:UDP-glucose 4-epimerase